MKKEPGLKIVFCSNFMNHHQLYFSKSLINKGVDFRFITTRTIGAERIDGGWKDLNTKFDWIVRIYESEEQLKIAKKLIDEADLVIAGSFPIKLIRKRILKNKLVFLYSERWFKSTDGSIDRFKTLHNAISNLIHRKYLNFFNVYMLCASAYTPYDCSLYGNFLGKCYKWGYFPYVNKYDIDDLIDKKERNKPIKLLWVARMLELKHPEFTVNLAKKLKSEGFDFEMNLIGIGEKYDEIKRQIKNANLEDQVKLLGSMSPEEVRSYMENANIFLFTSDYNEGWGAVLNEAMNSACAVVACEAIGSVPFLIKNGINGLTYRYADEEGLFEQVKSLMTDTMKRKRLGKEAYNTIITEWNPENAAKKLLQLYYALQGVNGYEIPAEGVCSVAPITK